MWLSANTRPLGDPYISNLEVLLIIKLMVRLILPALRNFLQDRTQVLITSVVGTSSGWYCVR